MLAVTSSYMIGVVVKVTEVRRLQEINDAIASAVIAHNDNTERQLAA